MIRVIQVPSASERASDTVTCSTAPTGEAPKETTMTVPSPAARTAAARNAWRIGSSAPSWAKIVKSTSPTAG